MVVTYYHFVFEEFQIFSIFLLNMKVSLAETPEIIEFLESLKLILWNRALAENGINFEERKVLTHNFIYVECR
jgi:hypothetical protein